MHGARLIPLLMTTAPMNRQPSLACVRGPSHAQRDHIAAGAEDRQQGLDLLR